MIRKGLAAVLLACSGLAGAESFDPANFDTGGFSDASFLLDGEAPTVEVPDCAGLDEAACTTLVEGDGFVAAPQNACSGSVAMGDVIGTVPTAGEQAASGSTVVIRVSTGVECSGKKGRRLGKGLGLGAN